MKEIKPPADGRYLLLITYIQLRNLETLPKDSVICAAMFNMAVLSYSQVAWPKLYIQAKEVDGVKHEYITLDGKIIRETGRKIPQNTKNIYIRNGKSDGKVIKLNYKFVQYKEEYYEERKKKHRCIFSSGTCSNRHSFFSSTEDGAGG